MFRVNSVIFHVTLGTYIAENERRNLRDEPPQQGTKIHELLQFHEKKISSCLAFTIVCKFKSYKVLLFVCCIKLAAASLRKEVFVPSLLHFLESQPNKFEKKVHIDWTQNQVSIFHTTKEKTKISQKLASYTFL